MANSPAIDHSDAPGDDWFQRLAETTTAALLVYDEERLVYANRALAELTGLPVSELVGMAEFWQLVAKADRDMVRDNLRARLAGEDAPIRYSFRVRRSDGVERWVDAAATRVSYRGRPAGLATLIDIDDYRRAEARLKEQAAFEQLVLRISRQFLSVPAGRFYDGVASALRALGEYTSIDRLTFFLADPASGRFVQRYVWHAVGCDVVVDQPGGFAPDRFPWSLARLRDFEPVYIPRVEDLPPEADAERAVFTALGLRSVVSVPVVHRRDVLGFVGLETIRQHRVWSEESLTLLKVVGQILAGALVRHRAKQALEREKERALVTLAAIGEGVIRTDAEGRVEYLNPVAERLTGWTVDDAAGKAASDIYTVVTESTGQVRQDPIALCLRERRSFSSPGLSVLLGRAGHELIVRDTASPILGAGGEPLGAVLVFEDLTEVRGLEREMAYLASHDSLTGLVNRVELEIHLEAALEAVRERGAKAALVKLDLVQFKLINDAGGHVAGDELLCQVAGHLREVVGEHGVLARVGGDEFAVLITDTGGGDARLLADRVLTGFRPYRFRWGGQQYDVGASVGVVPIDASSTSVAQVLKAADAACYLAHEAGGQRIHEYAPGDLAVVERYGQVQWVHRIRRALAEDRFCLYRQRIAPLGNDQGSMHEILLRLVDDHGRPIEPARFIPVAEQYRLGPALDRWVIGRALELIDDPSLGEQAPVSINLSGQSLDDESFLDYVVERLQASGVATERIFFEITETAAVAHLSRAVSFIGALRERGCRFILDDFGSGLSSFAYLKNLPVDLLKIDGAFVRSMEHDPIQREMVRSIHQIGHLMGLRTIAEWVENESTYALLEELEIDYVQGYYIHRPELLGPMPGRVA